MYDISTILSTVAPVVAATVGIVGGLVTVARNVKRLKRLIASDQTPLIVELRLLADTRLEMISTLTSQLASARAETEKTAAERDFAQRLADTTQRRLNDALDRLDGDST